MSSQDPLVGNLVKLRGEALQPHYGYGIVVSVSTMRGVGSSDFGFSTFVDVLWQSGDLYKSVSVEHLRVISGSHSNT